MCEGAKSNNDNDDSDNEDDVNDDSSDDDLKSYPAEVTQLRFSYA